MGVWGSLWKRDKWPQRSLILLHPGMGAHLSLLLILSNTFEEGLGRVGREAEGFVLKGDK